MKTRLIALWYVLTCKRVIVLPFIKCKDGDEGYQAYMVGDILCTEAQAIFTNEYARADEQIVDQSAQNELLSQAKELIK